MIGLSDLGSGDLKVVTCEKLQRVIPQCYTYEFANIYICIFNLVKFTVPVYVGIPTLLCSTTIIDRIRVNNMDLGVLATLQQSLGNNKLTQGEDDDEVSRNRENNDEFF